MMKAGSLLRWIIITGLAVTAISGCAHRAYLIVDYALPSESMQLKGQAVKIVVKDLRQDKSIFTPAAASEFQGFRDRYSLSWKNQDGSRLLVGEYNLKDLFLESFKERLKRMGVQVRSDESPVPVFEIDLQRFKINLSGRKWIADVIYEANLSQDAHLIAREKITGSAERMKIIGRKGADTVLSEIFSDIINRLNILKLFQQAKLV